MLAFIGLSANAQNWQWAKNTGSGNSNPQANSIATDINGRVYITGAFTKDTLIFGTDSLINVQKYNAFLTKYDGAGNVLWTRGSKGNSKVYGTAVTTDNAGYVYITGYFNSLTDTAVIFGGDTLANMDGNAGDGTSDIYVIKYDSTGTIQWAQRAGGIGNDISTGIATDNAGNVFVSGYMNGAIYTAGDSLNFGSSAIYYNGSGNMFLLKYTTAGVPVWAKSQAGAGTTEANSVATDSIGNVYVTGFYTNTQISFATDTLPNPGANNFIFLTKFNSSGTAIWTTGTGSSSHSDEAYSVVTDHSSNVFISGYLKGTTAFGSNTLTVSSGQYMFIAKYDSSGIALWAKAGGLGTYNTGYGMVTDSGNNVYVTGTYQGGISFDSATSFPSGKGLFVVKYSPSGIVTWAKNAVPTSAAPIGYGIARDSSNSLYITGIISSNTAFGNINLTSIGSNDILIAKLSNSNTGIDEIQFSKNDILVYPNPNNGSFIISDIRYSNYDLRIIDIYGRTVYSTDVIGSNGISTISVANLPEGLYFWQVIPASTQSRSSVGSDVSEGKIVILK